MKKISLILGAITACLLGAVVLLNSGCGKQTKTPPNADAKTVSATKTSFNEVTAQLDPGGNFYLYFGTAQWLDHLSTKIGGWRQAFTTLPDLKPDDSANIAKAFDIVTRLVADSGIEDVSGVGMSSVEIEPGLFRNKALFHHYPGKGDGFLWRLGGNEPHPLTGLDLLPADTALAVFSDADVALLWNIMHKEISQAGLPEAKAWLDKLPVEFEHQTKVKWNDFLGSLGGEFGLVLTLAQSNNIPVPLPQGMLEVPTPGLMVAIKVSNDTIFNRIDQELKANEQIIRVDQPGLKLRTMPIPLPFVGVLRPSAASSGGYLFIATSDALINDALAVKAGQKTGLKAGAEFQRLSRGLPAQGNQFAFMSERFTRTLMQVQQQAITANLKGQPQVGQWLQNFYHTRPAFAYTVGVNTPEGSLAVGNGSQSYANSVLLPAVAVPAMLAAIAVPNFVKARTTSQQNACINNLRQLDAAKNQWALENAKPASAVPTRTDIQIFLRNWPVCPQGGTYTLNPVDQEPVCSIPSHRLR